MNKEYQLKGKGVEVEGDSKTPRKLVFELNEIPTEEWCKMFATVAIPTNEVMWGPAYGSKAEIVLNKDIITFLNVLSKDVEGAEEGYNKVAENAVRETNEKMK